MSNHNRESGTESLELGSRSSRICYGSFVHLLSQDKSMKAWEMNDSSSNTQGCEGRLNLKDR